MGGGFQGTSRAFSGAVFAISRASFGLAADAARIGGADRQAGGMSQDRAVQLEQTVLDMIEHSPTGAVPHTPTYRDALARLRASHQVYPSADYKDGFVTVRSLAALPVFFAENLEGFAAGALEAEALEPDAEIFARYVKSLPAEKRARAEAARATVVARKTLHRARHGGPAAQDPAHTLLLVPGTGPHPGLPGNYLYGSLYQSSVAPGSPWGIYLHDAEDGAARCELPDRAAAVERLREVVASAPFQLAELDALGFHVE